MCIAYDLRLTVLRWPCVVDRTLKSNYYYYYYIFMTHKRQNQPLWCSHHSGWGAWHFAFMGVHSIFMMDKKIDIQCLAWQWLNYVVTLKTCECTARLFLCVKHILSDWLSVCHTCVPLIHCHAVTWKRPIKYIYNEVVSFMAYNKTSSSYKWTVHCWSLNCILFWRKQQRVDKHFESLYLYIKWFSLQYH